MCTWAAGVSRGTIKEAAKPEQLEEGGGGGGGGGGEGGAGGGM